MQIDSARRKTGAGMRRKRVAFASVSSFMLDRRGACRLTNDQTAMTDEAYPAASWLGASGWRCRHRPRTCKGPFVRAIGSAWGAITGNYVNLLM
jgi:hypothetical protein